MPRLALPSLILLLLAGGCSTPRSSADYDLAELARAEAARSRYRELQDREKPSPVPVYVPIRLLRGPYTEDGIMRTGLEVIIFVPRAP